MKKILIILSIIFLTGCSMYNTPTKQTELFLAKYQTLDSNIMDDVDNLVTNTNGMTSTQQDKYKEVFKRQYKDLVYEIKDEEVNGDDAVVTVEIEVYDLYKPLQDAEANKNNTNEDIIDANGDIDDSLYTDYKLDKLYKAKDRVKYTLEINLTKQDKDWIVKDLSSSDIEKINGTYAY